MRWTVEVTHLGTGEEVVIVVDAETAEQAAARARDSGFRVRDCYRAGRGAYKVIRVIAWVWFGFCSGLAVLCPVLGFGGWLATPGDPGEGVVGGIFLLVGGAALGLLVARAMTHALWDEPPTDPRRGFEVVVGSPAPPGPVLPPNDKLRP